MKKLATQVLITFMLCFVILLISRIYLNNLVAEGAIFLAAIIISQIFIFRSSKDLQALSYAIRRSMANNSFEVNLDEIKDPAFKKLGKEINLYLKEIYDKFLWKTGVADEMPIPFLIADGNNRVVYANQEILDMLEHDGRPEDYVGMDVGEFYYGEPGRRTATIVAFEEQRKVTGRRRDFKGRKGREFFAEVNVAPLYDPKGNLIGSFAVFLDLSELKAEQKKTAQQAEILKNAALEARRISDQLAAICEDFSAQVNEVNSAMEKLRTRTDEVATAMEEMNSTILEISKNAAQAAEAAESTAQKAQEGSNSVDKANSMLTRVQEKTKILQSHMKEMEKQAEGIGGIINTISDIADQTNLLALNAAIEAARAGDAGRGFAVVADEVRKLAEKTMNATKEVEEYIRTIQNSAKISTMSTNEVVDAIEENIKLSNMAKSLLEEMVNISNDSLNQIRSIATAAEEQSATSEHITRSTEEVNKISQETNEIMKKTSTSTKQITTMIQQLNEMILKIS